jgi:DNA-binding response OmpR family regulator
MTDAGARVLIVEDDARIAAFLLKGLRAKGFEPCWVETGGAALAAFEQAASDVVLLDLGLPDIDGLDVLARWRADGVAVPVVVLTARSDPRDRAHALELGVAGYLTKPAPFADVLAMIRSSIECRRAHLEVDR